MRQEKIRVSSKIGRILPVLIFSIVFVMPGFVYEGHSQDCEINCPLYEIIYTSKNLSGHVAYIEENPGGATDCPVPAVEGEDAVVISYDDYGEVIANPNKKHIWVNAIGAKKFWDKFPDGKNIVLAPYKYSGEFRLPTLPAPDDTQVENSEAVHFMIQLYDGTNTLLEADNHSLEFSILWKLNPWTDDYGKIFVYTGDPNNNNFPGVFETQIKLEPDKEWHSFEMIVNFETLKWVSITIDGVKEYLCDVDVARVKHDEWGDDFFFCITTESQPSWPQYNCEKIFTWTTQFRNLELGYWPAVIDTSKTQLIFAAIANGIFSNPQSFIISNSGCGTVDWTVSTNASWLNCTPTTGTSPGSVSASVDPEGLTPGSYTGTITVTDVNASNSPQTIPVTLNVYNLNQTSPPFGDFSTPLDGSTVSSSIPVTGWVLDDIEVESVKIYRGEVGNLIFIGDAVFVEGARPDVELAYPDYPKNYRAGWGYMMLTNFLPNEGNGTFKIHAVATDIDGHQVTLGTKTIICDNAHAENPFGAIDTPTQGGIASGSDFINWGWVLTPPPDAIPTDGSTIDIYVDGVKIGHPTYNIYRDDIAKLFPGYANSDGAVGYFYLDTAVYENGVYIIHWIATDNGGDSDGIGSRYFTIQNTNTGNFNYSTNASKYRKQIYGKEYFSLSQIAKIPVDTVEPIRIKKDFKKNVQFKPIYANEEDKFNITIAELGHLEIEFSEKSSLTGGYTIVGSQIRPLPVGSTLETKKGKFYWQLGPGFIGTYEFVFFTKDEYGNMTRKDVTVNIIPKSSKQE
jgi:hypothetical protein